MQDVFFSAKESYTQPLNPFRAYLEQLTSYIQTTRSLPQEKAAELAKTIFKERFRDRPLKCFERLENGDRIVKDTTLSRYINDNLKEGNILTPTFTSYQPRERRKSILSEFIFVSVAKRAVAKKEAHAAKAQGNMLLADSKNNEQNRLKTYNNSMSGSFAQEACILHNPSNHSTLTSITRTMTSLSNANNERIIAGNRYYPRGLDILNNLVYIVSRTNEKAIEEAMQRFDLYYPSVEDTVKVLRRSSDLYFSDRQYYETRIVPYLQKLSRVQLASICYSGDLYHLRRMNPDLIKRILDELTQRVHVEQSNESHAKALKEVDSAIVTFVTHIFFKDLKGKGKNYFEMLDTHLPASILATCENVQKVLLSYKQFFATFFMTDIMPCNAFRLKNMRRRTVVLSDTDSTCFTLDEWAKWYKGGEFIVDEKTIAVGGAIAYITTQTIVHLLRTLSRNLNIDTELIDKLGMKNEFLWLTHVPAEVSKHYYAYTVLQEDTVHKEPEIEIKGVYLKNSAVPRFVIEDGTRLMTEILEKVSTNRKVNFDEVVQRVVKLEEDVLDSVKQGSTVFLKKSKIRTADAYALEAEKSPFARHVFWNEVFGPKYGEFPEPPYDVIKLPTVLRTKTALNEWLESITDLALRSRLTDWLVRNNKKNLPTLYLNDTHVIGSGVPPEILSVVNTNRIILDVTSQHRVILETLGPMLYTDRLVKDQFRL